MSWMADIKKEQGEYREAAELMTKSKAMKDSIEQSKNTEKMLSLQNEIDKAEAARQTDMKLKTAAVAATVVAAVAGSGMMKDTGSTRTATVVVVAGAAVVGRADAAATVMTTITANTTTKAAKRTADAVAAGRGSRTASVRRSSP